MPARQSQDAAGTPQAGLPRVGCVSYLNSVPLIDGLDPSVATVRFDVPAKLLEQLQTGAVDVALCPAVDYFRSQTPLVLVPASGIGCEGPTLTVRLFSRVPIEQIERVHADVESHTSVALLQVVLHERYGLRPRLIDYRIHEAPTEPPQAVLLIGDKVVTDAPPMAEYPHGLDLGETWHELTGLPFVFAVWMARQDAELDGLPEHLAHLRERNAGRIDELAQHHAARHGWPADLARRYWGQILHYEIGPRQLEAMERFAELAAGLGLIERVRGLEVYGRRRAQ